jgi:hypothetical protein
MPAHGDLSFPPTNRRLWDDTEYSLFIREYRLPGGFNVFYEVHGTLQEVAWFQKVIRHHWPTAKIGATTRAGLGWFTFKAIRPLPQETTHAHTATTDTEPPDPVG